jgi:hypothetical protein
VETIPVGLRDAGEIEHDITAFAHGVAGHGSRAAARESTSHRHAHALRRERSASANPQCGFPAGTAAIGLDGRTERPDQLPLVRGHDTRRYAAELVALAPDVIFAPGTAAVGPLQQVTRSVPIVFVLIIDPVGSGFISSLAHPGGNTTSFTSYDYGIGGMVRTSFIGSRQWHKGGTGRSFVMKFTQVRALI